MNITNKTIATIVAILLTYSCAFSQSKMRIELADGGFYSINVDNISRIFFPDDPETLIQEPEPEITNNSQAFDYLEAIYTDMASGDFDIGYDMGWRQYTRALFTLAEFTTDECFWIWTGEGINLICSNLITPENIFVENAFMRLYHNIVMCNAFLRSVKQIDNADLAQAKLEARTLRAFSYYWLIDLYGNIGIVTENEPVDVAPSQVNRQAAYLWLESELEEVVQGFKDLDNPVVEYGHVGLDGAQGLLARLYLNAEVYLGYSRWYECHKQCVEIINRHQGGGYKGSGLTDAYLHLFCQDNDRFMPGRAASGQNEILFGLAYDENNSNYGGTMFLAASVKSSDVETGLYGAWMCMLTRPEFAQLFPDNDLRSQLWLREGNGHAMFAEWGDFCSGYAPIKFTNFKIDDSASPTDNLPHWKYEFSSEPFCYADLPLIRLAEIYLMYAECALRMGENQTKACEYVNLLRSRAGIDEFAIDELTLDKILDERGRELYQEMVRRSDLIRFGRYTGNEYNWAWKGNASTGRGIPTCLRLMPIPDVQLSKNQEWAQNEGFNTAQYDAYLNAPIVEEGPEDPYAPSEMTPLYLRGTMTNWEVWEEYRFHATSQKNVWQTDPVIIFQTDKFKVADAEWGTYNYGRSESVFVGVMQSLDYDGKNMQVSTDFYGVVEVRFTHAGARIILRPEENF